MPREPFHRLHVIVHRTRRNAPLPSARPASVFARIGIMRALNRHVERVFNPDRKETKWGRRKLARDR
jgi:hypothetical protein